MWRGRAALSTERGAREREGTTARKTTRRQGPFPHTGKAEELDDRRRPGRCQQRARGAVSRHTRRHADSAHAAERSHREGHGDTGPGGDPDSHGRAGPAETAPAQEGLTQHETGVGSRGGGHAETSTSAPMHSGRVCPGKLRGDFKQSIWLISAAPSALAWKRWAIGDRKKKIKGIPFFSPPSPSLFASVACFGNADGKKLALRL